MIKTYIISPIRPISINSSLAVTSAVKMAQQDLKGYFDSVESDVDKEGNLYLRIKTPSSKQDVDYALKRESWDRVFQVK